MVFECTANGSWTVWNMHFLLIIRTLLRLQLSWITRRCFQELLSCFKVIHPLINSWWPRNFSSGTQCHLVAHPVLSGTRPPPDSPAWFSSLGKLGNFILAQYLQFHNPSWPPDLRVTILIKCQLDRHFSSICVQTRATVSGLIRIMYNSFKAQGV